MEPMFENRTLNSLFQKNTIRKLLDIIQKFLNRSLVCCVSCANSEESSWFSLIGTIPYLGNPYRILLIDMHLLVAHINDLVNELWCSLSV